MAKSRTRTQRQTSAKKDPRDTPAMRQYLRFKEEFPDCILFFRMGDFYEMFDADAKLVHRVLGLTLTERTSGIPMAGVPYHAAEGYLQRLISDGYRVAICDQIQDPSEARGIVERAVTRVLTPGTLVDDSLLDAASTNATALVVLDDQATIAAAELSTGRFDVMKVAHEDVLDTLIRLDPAELLIRESDREHPALEQVVNVMNCACTTRADWLVDAIEGERALKAQWGVASLAGWGLEDDPAAAAAGGGLVRYLQETMPGAENGLSHMQPPMLQTTSDTLRIDASTLRHLEIERTLRSGGTEGSLLDAVQSCVSSMGRRLLRDWLCWPLTDRAAVEKRHDMVDGLLTDPGTRDRLRDAISGIQDVARIAGRAATGRITPRDITAIGRSLQHVPLLQEQLKSMPAAAAICHTLADLQQDLAPLGEDINHRCVEDPPAHLREGGLFVDGIDDSLDAARSMERDGSEWLAQYQADLTSETGIPTLKVGYNRVFGYYIEVTHAHADRVPPQFVRKQTLKNAERYITEQLKIYEDEALSARSRAITREQELMAELVEQLDAHAEKLRTLADAVATIDVLCGFAKIAAERKWVRPQMTDGTDLKIKDGRHPVLDARLGSDFVPNDCLMDSEDGHLHTLLLVTGPNMAGKSTWIRQVALITILAQAGCFVPASSACLGMADRIFARIGASDELHAGMSTFMVEMTETAAILHHATERSLVILDEIGRGTSTLDGLALAWAITEALATRGCRTLFATHYHELTDLGDRLEGVGNRHVKVQEWEDNIVFLHRIESGATDRSYGVHVGRIAGLPPQVIDRARDVLNSLEVHHGGDDVPPAGHTTTGQMGLFTEYVEHPVVTRLRDLDLERMSPLDAFDTLRSLHQDAEHGT